MAEGGAKKWTRGLLKQSQYCVSFVVPWLSLYDVSFQALQKLSAFTSVFVFVPILTTVIVDLG